MFGQPTIDELHAAHYAIRPKEGPRIPYHIGYALALAESERHLARLEDLEDEAAEAVHRLANIQGTMEQWLTAWGQ
jgi:hypothetical protein